MPVITATAISAKDSIGHIISDQVDSSTLYGVVDEIVNLLPAVIPVVVVFIGVKKAIGFLTGILYQA